MKLQFKGAFTVQEARQALFEMLHELEDTHTVQHVRSMTLYLTPCERSGNERYCLDSSGRKIEVLVSSAPYKSALDNE